MTCGCLLAVQSLPPRLQERRSDSLAQAAGVSLYAGVASQRGQRQRPSCLAPETVADLKNWDSGGGFWVHAGVLIEAEDRAALIPPPRHRASSLWARLIGRIFNCLPLTFPQCGTEMKLIAFITESAAIRAILTHVSESVTPPALAPRARAPSELATNRSASAGRVSATPASPLAASRSQLLTRAP